MHPQATLCALLITAGPAIAQSTTLSGTILAPTGDSVTVWCMKPEGGRRTVQHVLAKAPVDAQGRFTLRFDLDSARTLTFGDGSEVTDLFMLPGESLGLSLHTAYFDESLRFTGDGAERNGALATLALADEIDQLGLLHHAFSDGPDTAALARHIDERRLHMDAMLDDLVREHPELAGKLTARKAQNVRTAAWNKQYVPQSVAFSALRKEAVGKPAWDFKGVDLHGDTVHLSQFKGKTTVVDFWATWCGPCKAELPSWAELQKQYGDRINFVSVSIWDDAAKWKEMSAGLGHQHSLFIAKELQGQLDPYRITGIPRYMVIDKDLRIVTIDAPRPSSPELTKYF